MQRTLSMKKSMKGLNVPHEARHAISAMDVHIALSQISNARPFLLTHQIGEWLSGMQLHFEVRPMVFDKVL